MICVDGAAGPAPLASMVAPSPKVEPLQPSLWHGSFKVFDVFELQLPPQPGARKSVDRRDTMLCGTRCTAGCPITSAPFAVLFACAVVLGERAAPYHHHHNQRHRRDDVGSSSVHHWSEDGHDVSMSYRSVLGDPGMRWGAESRGAPTLNNPRMLMFFYNLCSKVSERDYPACIAQSHSGDGRHASVEQWLK
jgi:hypothetical protein